MKNVTQLRKKIQEKSEALESLKVRYIQTSVLYTKALGESMDLKKELAKVKEELHVSNARIVDYAKRDKEADRDFKKVLVESSASFEKFERGQKVAEETMDELKKLQPFVMEDIYDLYQQWVSPYLANGGEVDEALNNFKKEVVDAPTTSEYEEVEPSAALLKFASACGKAMSTTAWVKRHIFDDAQSEVEKEVVDSGTSFFTDSIKIAVGEDMTLRVGDILFQDKSGLYHKYAGKKEVVDTATTSEKEVIEPLTTFSSRFMPNVKFILTVDDIKKIYPTDTELHKICEKHVFLNCIANSDGEAFAVYGDSVLSEKPCVSKFVAIPELIPEGMVYDKESDSLKPLLCGGFTSLINYGFANNAALPLDEVDFSDKDPELFESFLAQAASRRQSRKEFILSLMSKHLFTYNQTKSVVDSFGAEGADSILEMCKNCNINPSSLKKDE